MGIDKTKQGLEFIEKEKASWEDVIKSARQVGFSAAKVLKLIDDTFRQEFFGKFDPGTYYLGSVYQEALDRLKKGEKDYAAQTFVLKHYPGLVDKDTIGLSYIYYRDKKELDAKPQTKKKIIQALRSKRNIIRNKYNRVKALPTFQKWHQVYFRADAIQKLIRKFYCR